MIELGDWPRSKQLLPSDLFSETLKHDIPPSKFYNRHCFCDMQSNVALAATNVFTDACAFAR